MTAPDTDATDFREDRYSVYMEYFVDDERKTMHVEHWAKQPEDAATLAMQFIPDHADFDPNENMEVTEGEAQPVELTVETEDHDMVATMQLEDADRAIVEGLSLKLWFYPEEQKVAIRKEQVDQFSDPALWYTLTAQLLELGYEVDWDTNWLPDDAEFIDEEAEILGDDAEIIDEDDSE